MKADLLSIFHDIHPIKKKNFFERMAISRLYKDISFNYS